MRCHGICQRIGPLRDGCVSWRNYRSSFSREALRGSWVYLPLDQRQKRHLTKKGKRIDCNISNHVPLVVPGLSTSSSTTPTSTSSSSSSQDSVFDILGYTENPVPERSGCTSEELRGNPMHKPIETENKNKNDGLEEVQSDPIHEFPDWLQEFRDNWDDERDPSELWRTPELGYRDTSSSSHELPMESRAKVELGSGKHSVHTHFAMDPNCDICSKTKITRASCRRRAGTVAPRAENYGELIHKILSEGSESRNNHRYVVVVQDLATQWIQSYPCKTKTSQETQKSVVKFLEPTRKPKVIYTDNSLEFGKCCEELSWNHCNSTPHTSETNWTAERAVRRVKEGTSAVLLQSGLNENWSKDSFYWKKGHLTDIHGPGGDLRGNTQPQDLTMNGQICGSICLMQRSAQQSKTGSSRNQSSIMPDSYVVSSSLNQMMKILKHTMRNARRKLEIPMPPAMPCKTPVLPRRNLWQYGKHKTKYACIVDSDESMRIRLERGTAQIWYHEDHIAAKGINSLSQYNLSQVFFPCPKH